MKIEAGLKYVTRNGSIVGPANPQPQSILWPWHIVGVGSFTDEGRFNGKFDHPNDLLSIAVERDNTRGPEINLATTAAEALQDNARLRAALADARPFVANSGDDEDPDASRSASELLAEIDRLIPYR